MTTDGHHRTLTVRMLVIALGLVLGLSLVLAGVAAWSILRPQNDVTPGRETVVDVPRGATTAEIAGLLTSAGVVDNEYGFRLKARLAKADGRLAPGTYEFTTGMDDDEVIARMIQGPPTEEVTVTIPEGFVIEQIAERLEAKADIPAKTTVRVAKTQARRFVKGRPYLADVYDGSLEGYLFPKTYRIRKGDSPEAALGVMLDQFDKELAGVDLSKARAAGMTLNDVVVIASIVEREARLDSERPLVSSVIRNRLRRGMRLEIDATIEYVLPGNRFRLRYSDLRIESPYNTYRVRGLPPGPIASPGLASLQAAAEPAETDYLYYVLTGRDGSHTFTTNKRDFLKAKQISKEVFGR